MVISSVLNIYIPKVGIDGIVLIFPWPGLVDGLSIDIQPAAWMQITHTTL